MKASCISAMPIWVSTVYHNYVNPSHKNGFSPRGWRNTIPNSRETDSLCPDTVGNGLWMFSTPETEGIPYRMLEIHMAYVLVLLEMVPEWFQPRDERNTILNVRETDSLCPNTNGNNVWMVAAFETEGTYTNPNVKETDNLRPNIFGTLYFQFRTHSV